MEILKPITVNKEEVEAIARFRVNQAEKKKSNYWYVGVMLVLFVGFGLVMKVSMFVGYGVIILGMLAFLWYNRELTQKQQDAKQKLVREWLDGKV